jgi:hypothetical protein
MELRTGGEHGGTEARRPRHERLALWTVDSENATKRYVGYSTVRTESNRIS